MDLPIFRVEIEEGELLPAWYYGVSYRDIPRPRIVCHIIPFNWIIRAWRNFSWTLRIPPFADLPRSEWGRRLQEVRDAAYEEGIWLGKRQADCHEAWQAGREAGRKEITEEIEAQLEAVYGRPQGGDYR